MNTIEKDLQDISDMNSKDMIEYINTTPEHMGIKDKDIE